MARSRNQGPSARWLVGQTLHCASLSFAGVFGPVIARVIGPGWWPVDGWTSV